MDKIKRLDPHRLFLIFLATSACGWIYEVLLCIFEAKIGFVNRGFLFGPYLPIYGFGSLIILSASEAINCFAKLSAKSRIVRFTINFVMVVALTTSVELISSYLIDIFIGKKLWDYTGYLLNFQGRIALKSSFRFGLGGMAILYLIIPSVKKVYNWIHNRHWMTMIYALELVFAIDLIARFFLGSNFVET